MKPVIINAFDQVGPFAAASKIAFGAACAYAAAGTIQATKDIGVSQNLIGVAPDDAVEKAEPGFYSQYDAVPLITAGRARVWVTGNNDADIALLAGDYLEIADVGGTNALPVGVFQIMTGEASETGAVREATSVARAMEDATLTAIQSVAATVAVGDTAITMASGDMTLLDLSAGDYILMEDAGGNCMINRVASTTATVINLQMASTVAMSSTTDDDIHKLVQVSAVLI